LTVLRRPNKGFDFGAHDHALQYLDTLCIQRDVFVFLNAGVTGPFLPAYLPRSWHWTEAFCDRLKGNVRLVGTSIVCLPHPDLGGYGPKVEGFAFAMDSVGMSYVRKNGTTFRQHNTMREAILQGEYSLTTTVMSAGFEIDSLELAYQGVNWNDRSNWNCNQNRHPHKIGTYFGITLNPLEVIFHKPHWHDGNRPAFQETEAYSKWAKAAQKRLFRET